MDIFNFCEMKLLGIKDIAYNKIEQYKAEYIAWSLNNPGQLMMGALSKEMGAQLAGYCENIDEINTLIRIEERKWKELQEKNSVNGCKWVIQGLKEVRDEFYEYELKRAKESKGGWW